MFFLPWPSSHCLSIWSFLRIATISHSFLSISSRSSRHIFCENQVVVMEKGLPQQLPPHVSPKGMWVSKLCLRILSFIFCIALLGVGGTIASGGTFTIIPLICIAPSVCFSIETGLTKLLTSFRAEHRGCLLGHCRRHLSTRSRRTQGHSPTR